MKKLHLARDSINLFLIPISRYLPESSLFHLLSILKRASKIIFKALEKCGIYSPRNCSLMVSYLVILEDHGEVGDECRVRKNYGKRDVTTPGRRVLEIGLHRGVRVP